MVRTWLQNTKNPFRGRPQGTNLIILQTLIHTVENTYERDFIIPLTTTFRQVCGFAHSQPGRPCGHWPAVCVEIQLHGLLLGRKGPFGSLVAVVQGFRVVRQTFIMANIFVQRIPEATWSRIQGYSQTDLNGIVMWAHRWWHPKQRKAF